MSDVQQSDRGVLWPELPLSAWQPTCDTLHMWTQIVGKVRMALSPPVNHYWHVPLYVSARGLTTTTIPCASGAFEIDFDFLDHRLAIYTSSGQVRLLPLVDQSVAEFYRRLMGILRDLGIGVRINPVPQEVPNPIPFDRDTVHAAYDREYAQRFWRILVSVEKVLRAFRGRFVGKSSPVHFFWGSFDLAVTRFSGRRAPERPGADAVTRESYSHECSSAGWWPGGVTPSGVTVGGPAFYSYISPAPVGLERASVQPAAARFDARLGEFLLMYDDVRRAPVPEAMLMEFLQSSYEAGATLAHWDREALEANPEVPAQEDEHAA